jgi:hypothetical protein
MIQWRRYLVCSKLRIYVVWTVPNDRMSGQGKTRTEAKPAKAGKLDKKASNAIRTEIASGPNDLRVSIPIPASRTSAEIHLDLENLKVEYEELLAAKKAEIDMDPLNSMILFPDGDVEVSSLATRHDALQVFSRPRELRTLTSSVPLEAQSSPKLDLLAKEVFVALLFFPHLFPRALPFSIQTYTMSTAKTNLSPSPPLLESGMYGMYSF